MIYVDSIDDLDSVEISPGIYLIGNPSYHEDFGQWICLANVYSSLAVVVLSIKVVQK